MHILLYSCEVVKHFCEVFYFCAIQIIMYSIFCELCKKKGVSAYKVCKDLGISQGTISNWKNRGNNLTASTMKKISDYFGVSVDYLMGNSDYVAKLNENDSFLSEKNNSEHINAFYNEKRNKNIDIAKELFEKLSSDQQESIINLMKNMK